MKAKARLGRSGCYCDLDLECPSKAYVLKAGTSRDRAWEQSLGASKGTVEA
jgi:hypothetical protein